jgi:hypothetical protein
MYQVDFFTAFGHVTYVTDAESREEAKENAWAKYQQDEVCWTRTPEELFDRIEIKEMP